ncbi:MAG: PilW family protein [Gammaproteobacteria bacterium]
MIEKSRQRFGSVSPPGRMRGLSLVEIMVALVIGMLTLAGLLTLFTQNKRTFMQDEQFVRMQDNARFALAELEKDLAMAGFWGDLLNPAGIVGDDDSLSIATDCGPGGIEDWMYQILDPVSGQSSALTHLDNATGLAATGSHSCIDAAEIVAGSDVVAIKRLEGRELAGAMIPSRVYLRTNGTVGLLYKEPMSASPPITIDPPFSQWRYSPRIYFIRDFSEAPGDGIPALCRKVLVAAAGPGMASECLASGVEDLQIEFGLDEDGDGRPDTFLSNPTLAQMQLAVSARIELLARTAEPDPRFVNDSTYRLGNAPAYTPNDNFRRRVYTTTVYIRNLSHLRRLGS